MTAGIFQLRLSAMAEAVMRAVEALSGLSRGEIFGKDRHREKVDYRRYCCYSMFDLADFSSANISDEKIGNLLGIDRQSVRLYRTQREALMNNKYFRTEFRRFERVVAERLDEVYNENPEDAVVGDDEDMRKRICAFISTPVLPGWEEMPMEKRMEFLTEYKEGTWDGDPDILLLRDVVSTGEIAVEGLGGSQSDVGLAAEINRVAMTIPEMVPAGFVRDSLYGVRRAYVVRHPVNV